MAASGQVEMSAFGDVVSLGSRTNGQELVRMSIKELDRVERVDRWEPRRASQRQRPGGGAPPGERGAQPRRAVIFYEGTNDITGNATFEQLKAGLQQVIDRVHAKGVAIYGGTVVRPGGDGLHDRPRSVQAGQERRGRLSRSTARNTAKAPRRRSRRSGPSPFICWLQQQERQPGPWQRGLLLTRRIRSGAARRANDDQAIEHG